MEAPELRVLSLPTINDEIENENRDLKNSEVFESVRMREEWTIIRKSEGEKMGVTFELSLWLKMKPDLWLKVMNLINEFVEVKMMNFWNKKKSFFHEDDECCMKMKKNKIN